MIDHHSPPGGPSRLHLKDLNAVATLAQDLTLPLIASLHAGFGDFGAAGHGDTVHSGLRPLEALNPPFDRKDYQ